ncbi:FUSC family membrane protein [Spirosoma knui]
MNKRIRQASYFLSSQYFSNGLRITLSILLPSLLFAQIGQLQTGMAMSLGALSVSLSDAPGPTAHRRNGMVATVLAGFMVTIVTGFARLNVYTLGLEIFLFGFIFSMLAVYGNRATAVGTAALLVMILMIDRPLDPAGVVVESGLILAGGVWYTAISMLSSRLQPYRSAQQALGECIHEIAKFLTIKADFYTVATQLDDDYRKLLAQQVDVSEKQDAVREILFKSRRFVAESTRTGRLLVLTFVDVVDLYEQIIAMYYDYSDIRERFGHTGVLDRIAGVIRGLATELDHIGLSIQSPVPIPIHRATDFTPLLEDVKQSIDALGEEDGSTLVLKKVLVSLRNLSQRLITIQHNLAAPDVGPIRSDLEYGRFVSHQEIDVKSILDNLTLDSSVFRHSVRVAVAMLLGFVLTKLSSYGHHSYWVILTISVILKPAFSLTKQRNIERISGTLVGGLVGLVILKFIPDTTIHFVFMVLFMLGTYSAQRVNYIVMVVCITPFVLILFSFLGASYLGVAEERFLDTLFGGVIALATGYLLFPNWESDQLAKPMKALLTANVRYMQLLYDGLLGRSINLVDYKLARKEVYVTSANLAAAFERMISEPKHKQRNERIIYEFVVLNHILSANVATITSALVNSTPIVHSSGVLRPAKRALFALTESLRQLGVEPEPQSTNATPAPPNSDNVTPDDPLLTEQLQFIQRVSSDISKLLEKVER